MSVFESGNPQYFNSEFWLDLLDIQLLELKIALKANDYNHAVKEAADLISVAQDMIRLYFSRDALFEANKRLVENLPKWNDPHRGSMDYQREKLRKMREELGE